MTYTKLHEAALCRHPDEIIALCRTNPWLAQETDANGELPLHIFAYGNPDVSAFVTLLAAYPEGVRVKNIHGDTPLHNACRCLDTESHLARIMTDIDSGVASIVNKEGLMPLHVACRHIPQHYSLIELLLEINARAATTPIKMGQPVVRREPAETPPNLHTIIDPSQGIGHKSTVDLRFEDIVNHQTRDGSYPIHLAIMHGNPSLKTIQCLIRSAPETLLKTNKFGESPLHIAVGMNSSIGVVEILISHGMEALRMKENRHGNLPLHVAALNGCPPAIISVLLSSWPGATLVRNNDGFTPLQIADMCKKCSAETIEMIRNEELELNAVHA